MADVTWPTADSFPTAPLLGWTEKPGKNVIRSETDSGPAKLRRRFTSAPSEFSMSFALTEDQATSLLTFFTDSCASGVKTFDGLSHPRTGSSSVTWRFLEEPTLVYREFNGYFVGLRLELLA